MEAKKDILWRMYLVYLLISLFAVAIITKICVIQFSEGNYWRQKAQQLTTSHKTVFAVRGNIFDANGSLLATSLPFYEVGMDVNIDYLTDELFRKNVDSLALSLSGLFKDKTYREYYKLLMEARRSGDKYILIKKGASYKELQTLKKFPLFRLGRYKGGLVYFQTNKRERPFKRLAARTIGYAREGIKPIGLEGAYDQYLQGDSVTRLMQKIAGGVWMPVNQDNDLEPKDGCDVITTIDINIQDVAEHALYTQLLKQNAGYGCAVLMEVKTGEIKAIVNLTRKDSGIYSESYNHAIGSATEPGSTFKLASLAAAMEDGYIDLDDTVDLGDGTCKFYDLVIRDSHKPEKRSVTVKEVFETSSNVGVARLIYKYYAKDPQKFIDRLYKMNLNSPLGLSIPGEGHPLIKKPKDKDWSGVTLPSMSRGYEVLMTPLQVLTFYNAFANNGKMVRPQLVKAIKRHGQIIKTFETDIINPSICSQSTIDKAKAMMEGVVENGTGKNLKVASYQIAGKTGTAQVAKNRSYGKAQKNITYQASFVGYFPADNPKYSCIVVVNAPSMNVYYGNVVAGPVFREIADKVYATSLEIHPEINGAQKHLIVRAPELKRTSRQDAEQVLSALHIPKLGTDDTEEWVKPSLKDSNRVALLSDKIYKELKQGIMPDVRGMTAQDAVYLLENKGLQVKLSGRGTIVDQSLKAGTAITKGTQIVLILS